MWQTIWAEDRRFPYQQAVDHPVKNTLFRPFAGYWHVVPRLLGSTAGEVCSARARISGPRWRTSAAAARLACARGQQHRRQYHPGLTGVQNKLLPGRPVEVPVAPERVLVLGYDTSLPTAIELATE